jgi:hypothetical protein
VSSCRPEPGHLLDGGPEASGTRGELAFQSSRQLGATEGRLAFPKMVVGVASLQKPSGPHKSTAKSSVPNEHAASSETAAWRMSLIGMSGTLSSMPDGTTINAHVATMTPRSRAAEDQYQRLSGHGHARLPDIVTDIVSEWAFNPD